MEGIPYLRSSLQLDPMRTEAWNRLGVALQAQGDLRSAAECYRKALEIDPQYAPGRNNLTGVLRLLSGN